MQSNYMPEPIKQFITNNDKQQIVYKGYIDGRAIEVIFTVFSGISDELMESLNKYIRIIYSIIYLFSQLSRKKCSKNLKIYFYFTDFLKMMPHDKSGYLEEILQIYGWTGTQF